LVSGANKLVKSVPPLLVQVIAPPDVMVQSFDMVTGVNAVVEDATSI